VSGIEEASVCARGWRLGCYGEGGEHIGPWCWAWGEKGEDEGVSICS
jgi:hypothetical protein